MNNEPYGWHCFIGKGKEEQDFLFINGKGASKPDASWDKVIPLYTHPVKELTNDELFHVIRRIGYTSINQTDEIVEAIRKAQSTCNGFCGEYECKENQAVCKRKAQEK